MKRTWMLLPGLMLAFTAHAATLRWAAQNDILTLDPHSQNHATTNAILQHAYEGLTRYNTKYEVEPALATKWTMVSPTQVRFELRHALLVQRGERLIENPQRRAVQIQARQRHAALLTGRQAVAGNIFETAQSYSCQRLPDGLAFGGMMQGAEPRQILFRGQQILDPGGVADPQQVACEFAALFGQRLAIEQDVPGGRLHQPGQ